MFVTACFAPNRAPNWLNQIKSRKLAIRPFLANPAVWAAEQLLIVNTPLFLALRLQRFWLDGALGCLLLMRCSTNAASGPTAAASDISLGGPAVRQHPDP